MWRRRLCKPIRAPRHADNSKKRGAPGGVPRPRNPGVFVIIRFYVDICKYEEMAGPWRMGTVIPGLLRV
jgi:hypothetical protein